MHLHRRLPILLAAALTALLFLLSTTRNPFAVASPGNILSSKNEQPKWVYHALESPAARERVKNGGGLVAADPNFKDSKITPPQVSLGRGPSPYVSTTTDYKVSQELNKKRGGHGVVMIDTSKIPNYDKHVDMRKHAKENKDYYTSTMETNVKNEKAKLFPTSIPAEACHLLSRRSAGAGGLYRRAGAGCKKGSGTGGGASAKSATGGGGGSARQAASSKPAAGGGKKKQFRF